VLRCFQSDDELDWDCIWLYLLYLTVHPSRDIVPIRIRLYSGLVADANRADQSVNVDLFIVFFIKLS